MSKDVLLNRNPVTVYRSIDENVFRLKESSDILLMNSENTVIDQKDCIRVILPSQDAVSQSECSPTFLQDCIKHLLTEFRVDTLMIQPEHPDCEMADVMIREFLLWSLENGYSMESTANKQRFTR